ncbi:MAG: DNA alkylation repair protein [Sphingobacterium sp.]|jgi:3-methyladenine DNA glycosylase AlkC|uniref:DNA alkylation repair protein n=1 Tax=Sphingobacterium sp. TaxID=341027 RepID=UPI00284A823D|nr:DNA alkylation repair protein [Sphingobacterium sp.]MDR3006981.1 DNA alkylation repair protein [Sphingobacterium sp.]
MSKIQRKGARRMADISIDCLDSLNRGEIETANLVEWLAVDQRLLLEHILQQNGRLHYLKPILLLLEQLQKPTVNSINETIGRALLDLATQHRDTIFLTILSNHAADLVRCWATYTIGDDKQLEIEELLFSIRPFAADTHFGVREISWMAIRNRIAFDLDRSIAVLSLWTMDKDENLRRFASESTRPRGVWCKHIDRLKQEPSLALPILEPLKSDPSKYVRDSVGNWLNDASKSQPGFVRALCHRWEEESDTKETKYIIRKALRTILK